MKQVLAPCLILALVAATAHGGLAQGTPVGGSTGPDARAFDRVDRHSREIIHTVHCAGSAAQWRARGRFGPPDSLGSSGQCLDLGGASIGVFLDADSARHTASHLAAVNLSDGSRYLAPLDTARLVARALARDDAIERGYPDYEKANRQFVPLTIWPRDDSLQVWLFPVDLFLGKGVGGERGFLYSSSGSPAGIVDAMGKYRAFQATDSGTVEIRSLETELPLLSEMVLANLLNEAGRTVTIVTTRFRSTLTGRGAQAMWVHFGNAP